MGTISRRFFTPVALTLVALSGTASAVQASSELAEQVRILVNQRRAEAGLPPLRQNAQLQAAAQQYAEYMARTGTFSHNGSDGSTPWSRMAAAGYRGSAMGENIARGFTSPASVMEVWMNSPGHRANILNSDYNEIGVGVADSNSGKYWVQNFGAGEIDAGPAPAPLGPVITSITPYYARMGDPVTISGQRFGVERGSVTFAGGKEGESSSWADTRIVCTVPFGANTGMVYVQTKAGTSAGSYFYVLLPQGNEPFLQKVTPASAPPGTAVTIYGQRLGPTRGTVTFGGVPATVTSWSPSGYYLQAIVPAGASDGPIVITRASDGAQTNGLAFTVNEPQSQPVLQPSAPQPATPIATPTVPQPTTPPQGWTPNRRSYSPYQGTNQRRYYIYRYRRN